MINPEQEMAQLKARITNLEEVLRDVISASVREFGTDYAATLIDRIYVHSAHVETD